MGPNAVHHRHIVASRGLCFAQTNVAEMCPSECTLLAHGSSRNIGYSSSYSYHQASASGISYCKFTEKNGAPLGIAESFISDMNPVSIANSSPFDSPSLNSEIISSFSNEVCSE